ncbi:MAG: helix-turn-helix transcriptional regulator [Bacteroidales bacterium]|nr:helix-turn-helix transcriptional regulator [Bacteroidales bacterium]
MKERIQQLINKLGYTTARFADEIGVQRSGISHIISGRNQPSYDLLVKILSRFPDISTDWFLLGKGEMFRHHENEVFREDNQLKSSRQNKQPDLFSSKTDSFSKSDHPDKKEDTEKVSNVTNVNNINRILILHNDGTFNVYHPADRD